MKKRNLTIAVLLITGLFIFISLYASSGYKMKLNGKSMVWIEGDSSMHAYKSISPVVNIISDSIIKVKPAESIAGLATDKKYAPYLNDLMLNLKVKLNVKSFRSTTPGFDGKFYETIKADNYPEIVFTPAKYSITKDARNKDMFYITSEGVVRIAGREKTITVTSFVKVQGDTAVISGQKDLLMTDFGLTPPELLFVKAENKVTVKWNINVSMVPVN